MRDIRDCSGPWKGIWTQGSLRGTMHAFRLGFSGDEILGDGRDLHGDFVMLGTYEVAGDLVDLLKSYWHTQVHYEGIWNGSFVAGRSTIGPPEFEEYGSFEMWPEDEESATEVEMTSVEDREPIAV